MVAEEGDVLTLDAGDVGQAGASSERRGELLLEIAADDVLTHAVGRVRLGDGSQRLLVESFRPDPQDELLGITGTLVGRGLGGSGASGQCRYS